MAAHFTPILTMQSTLTPQDKLLSRALLAAISTVADFDESLPTGNGPVVPEVIIWMLEQTNPVLMFTLNEDDLQPALAELIADYGHLRKHALPFYAFRGKSIVAEPFDYSELPVRIIFDDLEAALDSSNAPVTARFTSIFQSIAPGVRRRLEEMDPVEWGNPESVPARDEAGGDDTYCVHQKEYEFFRAAMVEPYLGDDPVEDVVDFMVQALIDEDFGKHADYWMTVDVSVMMRCAELDMPDKMAKIMQGGRTGELKAALLHELDVLRETELAWSELSTPLRSLLANHAEPGKAIGIIKMLLDARDTTTDRSASDIGVYWMFCRRLSATFNEAASLTPLPLDDSPVIDLIRQDVDSAETFYLVNTTTLFGSRHAYTCEKQCVVIRLPEQWLQVKDALATDTGLQRFASQYSGGSDFRLNLTPNRAFWAPEEKLRPHLYRWMSAIPVVYVFESCCLFAHYKFNRLVDLQKVIDTPIRQLPDVTIEKGEWRYGAKHHLTALPDGTHLKPVILREVRDMTTNLIPQRDTRV